MWWRRRNRVEAVESDAQLRVRLVAAAEDLRRQIDVQNAVRYSRGGGQGGDDLAVAMLQTQLGEVEDAIANLDPGMRC